MGTTGREWRNAEFAHGVSGRVDHGDRIERRIRFEHICVVFGVFTGGTFVVVCDSSVVFVYARVYIVGKGCLCLGRCRISTLDLSRETERWMMISSLSFLCLSELLFVRLS